MSPLPAFCTRLVDDAAIFPPGNAPLDRAVSDHTVHRASPYADLIGGFVVSDVLLPDLIEVLNAAHHSGEVAVPLGIKVVLTGGAGALEPAVRWAVRSDVLGLAAVEVALRDLDDLGAAARRVVAAVDGLTDELDHADVFVEVPWTVGTHGWQQSLDELALRDLRVKFRTGGSTADAFPTATDLAAGIDAALDRELAFKCTAGLHHAIRHTDPATGFEHHGFLNVLLATRTALDGGDVVSVLEERDASTLVAAATAADLAGARRWFTGFGTCNVLEPHDDLVALGLVEGTA